MLTPESVIPWLEGKPTVASILEQHQTDSARVAELEAANERMREVKEHNEGMEKLIDRLIETCPESRHIIAAFAAEAVTPKG